MTKRLFINKTKNKQIRCSQNILKERGNFNYKVYLRGQPNESDGLLPTIARTNHKFVKYEMSKPFNEDQELNFLHRFKRYTYEYQGRILNEWEALILARHHGLPVRLLDWTTNPLVALYWAANKEERYDGAIWIFQRRNRDRKDDIDIFKSKHKDPMKIPGVRIIYPFNPTPRMTAQSALFTIHGYPWKDISKSPNNYLNEESDILHGEKWLVPKQSKGEIIKQLDMLGINERTLLPGLDGIASGILHTELIFRDE